MISRRVAWFIAVGCAAAALHFGAVLGLVQWLALPPLLANVGGWLLALGLSFTGHLRLSFADQRAPARRAALRFVAVSAGAFAVNEALYALLLRFGGMDYRPALVITLVVVAFGTFLLSRHWAFRGS